MVSFWHFIMIYHYIYRVLLLTSGCIYFHICWSNSSTFCGDVRKILGLKDLRCSPIFYSSFGSHWIVCVGFLTMETLDLISSLKYWAWKTIKKCFIKSQKTKSLHFIIIIIYIHINYFNEFIYIFDHIRNSKMLNTKYL